MFDLTPYRSTLSLLVPDWKAGAIVDCVPGCGLSYTGKAILVLTPEAIVMISQNQEIIKTIKYESVIRVKETEFKGLVMERAGALVALNETAGVEISYNGAGRFERSIKVLTRQGNSARAIIDTLNRSIETFLDALASGDGTYLRQDGEDG